MSVCVAHAAVATSGELQPKYQASTLEAEKRFLYKCLLKYRLSLRL